MHLHIQHVHQLTLMLPSSFAELAATDGEPLRVTTAETGAPPPALGTLMPEQGGYYGGHFAGRDGAPGYHLIWSISEGEDLEWGPCDHAVDGAASHYDGQANTAALLADDGKHPAAAWAAAVRDGGHRDWYLPSHAELAQAWINVPQLFQADDWYWSSTQYGRFFAWCVRFSDGCQYDNDRILEFRARAVRRFIPGFT